MKRSYIDNVTNYRIGDVTFMKRSFIDNATIKTVVLVTLYVN